MSTAHHPQPPAPPRLGDAHQQHLTHGPSHREGVDGSSPSEGFSKRAWYQAPRSGEQLSTLKPVPRLGTGFGDRFRGRNERSRVTTSVRSSSSAPAEAMRRAKEARRGRSRAHHGVGAELEVTPYVRGRPEVKFPMEVAVVAERVPLGSGASDQVRPTLGVAAEDEEGRFDAALGERVEDEGRRGRVRSVVEGERDGAVMRRQAVDRGTEDGTVAVKCAMRGPADHDGSRAKAKHHTATATLPRTV